MDENFVWCALIIAMAYIFRDTLPTYRELTESSSRRLDAINDAVDENEQVMLGMGEELKDLQSDVAGHLTRIDDLDGNAIVGLRAVNTLDESNVVIRHGFQFLVGETWIDVPVENVWERADD